MNDVSRPATRAKRCVLLGGTGRSPVLYVVHGSTVALPERRISGSKCRGKPPLPSQNQKKQFQPALLLPPRVSTTWCLSPLSRLG